MRLSGRRTAQRSSRGSTLTSPSHRHARVSQEAASCLGVHQVPWVASSARTKACITASLSAGSSCHTTAQHVVQPIRRAAACRWLPSRMLRRRARHCRISGGSCAGSANWPARDDTFRLQLLASTRYSMPGSGPQHRSIALSRSSTGPVQQRACRSNPALSPSFAHGPPCRYRRTQSPRCAASAAVRQLATSNVIAKGRFVIGKFCISWICGNGR